MTLRVQWFCHDCDSSTRQGHYLLYLIDLILCGPVPRVSPLTCCCCVPSTRTSHRGRDSVPCPERHAASYCTIHCSAVGKSRPPGGLSHQCNHRISFNKEISNHLDLPLMKKIISIGSIGLSSQHFLCWLCLEYLIFT